MSKIEMEEVLPDIPEVEILPKIEEPINAPVEECENECEYDPSPLPKPKHKLFGTFGEKNNNMGLYMIAGMFGLTIVSTLIK